MTTSSGTSPRRARTRRGSRISPCPRTDEGKLYVCAIKDVCSNRIVGYSIDARMKTPLAVSALHNAIGLREPAGTLVHSDRGSQFRSNAFVRTLKNNGLIGSTGRVGTCADNAAMKSFFSLLQKNVLDSRRWATQADLHLAIVTWIKDGGSNPLRQRHRVNTEVLHDLLGRHSGLTIPRDAHHMVMELIWVGLGHSSILPGPPSGKPHQISLIRAADPVVLTTACKLGGRKSPFGPNGPMRRTTKPGRSASDCTQAQQGRLSGH